MTGVGVILGIVFGVLLYIALRSLMLGFFTVAPNERAVLTSFRKAERLMGRPPICRWRRTFLPLIRIATAIPNFG